MDEDGIVPLATIGNVANRARVSLEDAQKAISELESPEPDTATPDNDGRRIERIPGGWHVLNAAKYRGLVTRSLEKEATRKRVAEWRIRKKSGLGERIKDQGSKCLCCGEAFQEPYNLYVVQDHDHKTGVLRDLICQSCNTCVGRIENGKPVLSDSKRSFCIEYLKRHGNARVTPSEAEAYTEAETKNPTARKAVPSEPEEFKTLVSIYPKRAGANPRGRALRAANARITEGASWEEMIDGARRYQAYIRATGKEGTEFVRQLSTFVGPDKSYLDPWALPATKAQSQQDSNVAASMAWLEISNAAAG